MEMNGRKLGKLGMVVALCALLLPGAAVAQGGPGTCPGCPRMGAAGAPAFDAAAVTTIRGEIVEIRRLDRGRGHQGVHLVVAVGSERLAVHLGPDFYVDAQALKLAKGDTVEVKGARATLGGEAALIAQEVRRGDEVLALRDAAGVPLWRGAGMRRR